MRKPGRKVALYVALGALSLVFALPLLWMAVTSLKTNAETTTWPPTWLPAEPSTEGYQAIVAGRSDTPVFRWFLNSMLAASAHTVLVLVTASLAAYPLARMEFRGRNLVFGAIITTMFVPGFIFLMPNYLIVDGLGWIDSLLAVIVPGVAGALGVFFLRQFFLSLPTELEEAALIDGANRWQIFLRVILPLAKAPLATLAVLSFLSNWNDFLWPVYVLFTASNLTLPPGLSILQGAYTTNYAVIMAGGVLATAPILLLYVLAQRYIIEGVARSGLKG